MNKILEALEIVEKHQGISNDTWRHLCAAFTRCHKDIKSCPHDCKKCFNEEVEKRDKKKYIRKG